MAFTGLENHDISWDQAAAMTRRYRDARLNEIRGGFFSRAAIEKILKQSDCVGIRIYLGLDADTEPKLTMVLSGALENEDDIEDGLLAEFAKPCPSQCGKANALNGL